VIHRSWFGFVKTPMLGLTAFTVPFILKEGAPRTRSPGTFIYRRR
jgi:hypothetical protein